MWIIREIVTGKGKVKVFGGLFGLGHCPLRGTVWPRALSATGDCLAQGTVHYGGLFGPGHFPLRGTIWPRALSATGDCLAQGTFHYGGLFGPGHCPLPKRSVLPGGEKPVTNRLKYGTA
jgi:hypothetical protein